MIKKSSRSGGLNLSRAAPWKCGVLLPKFGPICAVTADISTLAHKYIKYFIDVIRLGRRRGVCEREERGLLYRTCELHTFSFYYTLSLAHIELKAGVEAGLQLLVNILITPAAHSAAVSSLQTLRETINFSKLPNSCGKKRGESAADPCFVHSNCAPETIPDFFHGYFYVQTKSTFKPLVNKLFKDI
jgi:hypothetical protein